MAKQSKENAFKRLTISFCILIILFILFGLLSINDQRTSLKLTRTIYDHPFVVSKASLQSDTSIIKMHRSMKDVVLFNFPSKINASIKGINEEEQKVYNYLDIVKNKILGDEGRKLEEEARKLFNDWKPIREEVIELISKDQREKAANITKGKGADHVANLESKMLALTDYAQRKAFVFMQSTEKVHSRMYATLIVFLIIGVISSSFISFFTIKRTIAAERSLKESESLLDATQQLTNVGGWEWDAEKQTMLWSDEVYRIHDFQQSEFTPGDKNHIEQGIECYDPEDRPVIMEAFKNCIEKGQAYNLEFPFTTLKGRRIWIRTMAEAVRKNGTIVKVLGNIMDISKNKQAENELLKSQYFLKKAQEIGQIGTWELDNRKNELRWTDENYKIFGIPIGTELTYEKFLNCVYPEDRNYVDSEWKASFNKKPYDIEHRLLVDGKLKWVREKAELEFNEKDECVRGTGFTQDITKQKQAEKVLKEVQRYTRELFETNLDALVTISAEGKITDVNKATELITGMPRKEIIGTDFSNYFTVPEAARKGYQQIFKDGYIRNYPLEIRHFDGRVIPVRYNASVYKDPQGNVVNIIAAARDISELKKEEEKRENLIKELQEALENVKILSGLLPICAKCKKIRDDKGYWNNLEEYIQTHSDASFSHGMCSECSDELYGKEDWYIKMKNKEKKKE